MIESPESPAPSLDWDDDDRFVTVRNPWWRHLRSFLSVFAIGLIVIVGALTIKNWFDRQLDPPGEPGEAIELIVPRGATTSDIGRQLATEGVIPNSTFFRYYAEWTDKGNFQAGEYVFNDNMSAEEAIAVLETGPKPPVYTSFRVSEGAWVSEMLPQIANQLEGITVADLQAVLDRGEIVPRYRPDSSDSWEGLLFPDTYEVEEDSDAVDVLLKLSDQFSTTTGDLGYGAAENRVGLPAYDVLIIASLIEAEAKTDQDRPKIARVIYNRLRKNEPIGIDATFIYEQGDRRVELTRSILDTDTPYNSRTRVGLPPTPIGAPSEKSLRAALNPEEGEWLYYVLADAEGNHFFTESYDEFLEQKQISQDAGLF